MPSIFTPALTPCCSVRFKPDANADFYLCESCGHSYTFSQFLAACGAPLRNPNVRMVPIQGNTYAVKEELKAFCQARWDSVNRRWMVPDHQLAEAQRIVNRGAVPGTSSWTADDFRAHRADPAYNPPPPAGATGSGWTNAPPRPPAALRACWECSESCTEHDYRTRKGSWSDFWCGCTDA